MGLDHRVTLSRLATTLIHERKIEYEKKSIPNSSFDGGRDARIGGVPAQAAKVRVVTTLTDLADLTRNIGGDHVDVFSLATGVEDTHGVPMKPSFVPIMNRADLLVLVGFGCEHAFLPALLEASKNPHIQDGQPGYVDCAKGVVPMEVPKSTDHSAGDVHPYGNPHYMLDPVLAKTAIQNIYDALVNTAPDTGMTSPATATPTLPNSMPRLRSGKRFSLL